MKKTSTTNILAKIFKKTPEKKVKKKSITKVAKKPKAKVAKKITPIKKATSKIKIIESLWKIIYSDNNADMYETGMMRRLAGLLYLDPKIMGDLKEKIKKELKK